MSDNFKLLAPGATAAGTINVTAPYDTGRYCLSDLKQLKEKTICPQMNANERR